MKTKKSEELCEKEILEKILHFMEGMEDMSSLRTNNAHGVYDIVSYIVLKTGYTVHEAEIF